MAPLEKGDEAAPFPRHPRQDLQQLPPHRQEKARAQHQKKKDPRKPQSPLRQSTKGSLRQEKNVKEGVGEREWKEGTFGGEEKGILKEADVVIIEKMLRDTLDSEAGTPQSERFSMKYFDKSDAETMHGSALNCSLKKDDGSLGKSFDSDMENMSTNERHLEKASKKRCTASFDKVGEDGKTPKEASLGEGMESGKDPIESKSETVFSREVHS